MPIDESSRILGTQYFRDIVTFAQKPVVPAASFPGTAIDSATPVPTQSLRHRYAKSYSQGNVASTTETRGLHIAAAAGTIKAAFVSNSSRAVGDSTVTVDIRKNGVTVLTAVVTLDNAHPAAGSGFATVTASLSGTPADLVLAIGDVIDCIITATVGTGTLPKEVQVQVVVDEDP